MTEIEKNLAELQELRGQALAERDRLEKEFDDAIEKIPYPSVEQLCQVPQVEEVLRKFFKVKRNFAELNPRGWWKQWYQLIDQGIFAFGNPLTSFAGFIVLMLPAVFGLVGVLFLLAFLSEYTLLSVFVIVLSLAVGVSIKRKVDSNDEKAWRLAAGQSVIQKAMVFMEFSDGLWSILYKAQGYNPGFANEKNSLDISPKPGEGLLFLFPNAKDGSLCTLYSGGLLFYPGQDNFPVKIELSASILNLFRFMAELREPALALCDARTKIQNLDEALEFCRGMHEKWGPIHLQTDIKDRITRLLGFFMMGDKAAPRGLLLSGPPGTGKTLIAKAIADTCGAAFFPTSLPDFKMGGIGQSAQKVREFWNEVRQQPNAVIFIDECEGVFGTRGGTDSDSFTAEIVQSFLAEWDGIQTKGEAPTVWVLGATNRRELIDQAILSRFGEEIVVPLPNAELRCEIFKEELKEVGLETNWLPNNLAQITQGMSGRDLNKLASSLKITAGYGEIPTEEHLLASLATMRKRGGTKTSENATWDTLVLDEGTLKELKTSCKMLQHADELSKQGVTIPRGLIFYGPPGTGKTQIARTLANESGLSFVAATTGDMKAGWLGQSGMKVKELFSRVRSQSPAILFIDEIDIVCPGDRGSSRDALVGEIVGQLLQELDGVKESTERVFVVAATNDIDNIDSAILSRFPKRIKVDLPDFEGRQRMIKIMLKSLKNDLSEDDIFQLAEATSGKSGRDLRSIVENAQNLAVARAFENETPTNFCINRKDFAW